MSDFGGLISIQKSDQSFFTKADEQAVKAVVEQLREEITLTSSLGKPYLFLVGKTERINEPKCYELNVLLSEYSGDATQFKWHETVDAPDARTISAALATALGPAYLLNPTFGWW